MTHIRGPIVLVAAIMLPVKGTYPSGLFDFIVGPSHWVLASPSMRRR